MKHVDPADAARAASYVLGLLPDEQRAAFEERVAASPALRDEVASLRAVADELTLAAPPVEPSSGVRERLLARVAAEAAAVGTRGAAVATVAGARGDEAEREPAAAPTPAGSSRAPRPPLPELLFALAPDASWTQVAPGLEVRLLARGDGGASYVLRLAPGASIPTHAHRRVEHTYVLSGSIEVEGTLCRAGDYHRAAAGTRHDAPHSAEGCTLLVVEAPS